LKQVRYIVIYQSLTLTSLIFPIDYTSYGDGEVVERSLKIRLTLRQRFYELRQLLLTFRYFLGSGRPTIDSPCAKEAAQLGRYLPHSQRGEAVHSVAISAARSKAA